ncbi:hypothetical protein QBC40DRAFT_284343 [Triangularia verruculosa]|uniref:Uncharacterized protein n=1 Tax=Triangularia verruculosa TaxID=2587418 RepID=A0AAN6XHZ2_9PEZI|nr:hypothetical protein QBC40DRAFT_284343 [Triangularia verruculosa]
MDYRLQVWHYSIRRQNYDDNDLLCRILSSKQELRRWTLYPVQPTVEERQPGAGYFPLEVDLLCPLSSFPWPGSSDPVSDLVETFSGAFPAFIKEYFDVRPGEPHQLVLFPTNIAFSDATIPDATKFSNTHVKILKSLEVAASTTSTVGSVTPSSNIPKEICLTVMSMAQSIPLGIDTACLIINSTKDWLTGKSRDRYNEVCTQWAEAGNTGELFEQAAGSDIRQNISRDWTKADEQFSAFIQVTETMEHIVECLSSNSGRVSPQNLYEAMIHARNASVALSAFQNQMRVVTNQLVALKASETNPFTGALNAGIIAIAMIASHFTGEMFCVAGAFTGSALLLHIHQRYQVSKHNNHVNGLIKTIGQLSDALKKADVAFAALFCSRVLRKPLDSKHISISERRRLLQGLGIDDGHVPVGECSPDTAVDSILAFCTVYKDLKVKVDSLKTATNFTTLQTRSGVILELPSGYATSS